jgi:hypothetical protein
MEGESLKQLLNKLFVEFQGEGGRTSWDEEKR